MLNLVHSAYVNGSDVEVDVDMCKCRRKVYVWVRIVRETRNTQERAWARRDQA